MYNFDSILLFVLLKIVETAQNHQSGKGQLEIFALWIVRFICWQKLNIYQKCQRRYQNV